MAGARPRYGARRLHVLLRREGWVVNHKKVHRLYKEAGLQLQARRKKKRPSHMRMPGEQPKTINIRWAMDFMHDRIDTGRRFRLLAILDLFSRECLLIEADYSLRATNVVESLERVRKGGCCPEVITVDNVLTPEVKSESGRNNPLLNNHCYQSNPSVFH